MFRNNGLIQIIVRRVNKGKGNHKRHGIKITDKFREAR